MAGVKILNALKNPWTVAFSAFGLAYGGYNIIELIFIEFSFIIIF